MRKVLMELVSQINQSNQNWETPPEFFNLIDKYFNFNLDVCALRETAKCDHYFGPDQVNIGKQDGLTAPWEDNICWCNPPYSDPKPWVEKAILELEATTVMLLPTDSSTQWFADAFMYASEIWFLKPRIRFVGAVGSPRWANMLVIFRPQPPCGLINNTVFKHFDWKQALEVEVSEVVSNEVDLELPFEVAS